MPFPAPLPANLAADSWRLQALSDDHWELEWAMSRDPEVVRWTLYPPDLTEESARERVRRTRQRAEDQIATRYAILDHDGTSIGTAGIACRETSPARSRGFLCVAAPRTTPRRSHCSDARTQQLGAEQRPRARPTHHHSRQQPERSRHSPSRFPTRRKGDTRPSRCTDPHVAMVSKPRRGQRFVTIGGTRRMLPGRVG